MVCGKEVIIGRVTVQKRLSTKVNTDHRVTRKEGTKT